MIKTVGIFGVLLVSLVLAAGCKITVTPHTYSDSSETAESDESESEQTGSRSKKSSADYVPSDETESEETSEDTGKSIEVEIRDDTSELERDEKEDQKREDRAPEETEETDEIPDIPGEPEDDMPPQPENYEIGADAVPSLPGMVGQRWCSSSDERDGAYQDMPCKIWEYVYESDTVFDDLLTYLNSLRHDHGFDLITDMDLTTPEGDVSLAIESVDPGKLIILHCEWNPEGYKLVFSVLEGTLTRKD